MADIEKNKKTGTTASVVDALSTPVPTVENLLAETLTKIAVIHGETPKKDGLLKFSDPMFGTQKAGTDAKLQAKVFHNQIVYTQKILAVLKETKLEKLELLEGNLGTILTKLAIPHPISSGKMLSIMNDMNATLQRLSDAKNDPIPLPKIASEQGKEAASIMIGFLSATENILRAHSDPLFNEKLSENMQDFVAENLRTNRKNLERAIKNYELKVQYIKAPDVLEATNKKALLAYNDYQAAFKTLEDALTYIQQKTSFHNYATTREKSWQDLYQAEIAGQTALEKIPPGQFVVDTKTYVLSDAENPDTVYGVQLADCHTLANASLHALAADIIAKRNLLINREALFGGDSYALLSTLEGEKTFPLPAPQSTDALDAAYESAENKPAFLEEQLAYHTNILNVYPDKYAEIETVQTNLHDWLSASASQPQQLEQVLAFNNASDECEATLTNTNAALGWITDKQRALPSPSK